MRIRVVDYCNGRSNVASVNVRARVETGDNDDDDDDNDDDDDDDHNDDDDDDDDECELRGVPFFVFASHKRTNAARERSSFPPARPVGVEQESCTPVEQ